MNTNEQINSAPPAVLAPVSSERKTPESFAKPISGAGLRWHLRRRGWIVLDTLLGAGAILVAYWTHPSFTFAWESSVATQPGPFQAALLYPSFVALCMHVAGLHDPLGDQRRWYALLRIAVAVMAALALCLFCLYLISLQQLGRTILLRTFFLSVALLSLSRFAIWRLAGAAPRRIGCYLAAQSHARFQELVKSSQLPIEVTMVRADANNGTAPEIVDRFVLHQVDEVVVAASEQDHHLWLACLNQGISVTELSLFIEREFYKVPCDDIGLSWLLRFDLKWNHPFYHRLKRLMDVIASGVGLVVTAPLILLAAAAILLESGRPVFYSQIRVGFRGKPYRIWKLRTMRTDAEANGAQWAKQRDGRVTAIGRILRITRIDELPQFINVLKGEMSLIGPRPERPQFVDQLAEVIPMYHHRHLLKPGITGWAQINYPYGASVHDAREKLCYDLYYLKNASLLLDVHIALRTLGVVMKGSR